MNKAREYRKARGVVKKSSIATLGKRGSRDVEEDSWSDVDSDGENVSVNETQTTILASPKTRFSISPNSSPASVARRARKSTTRASVSVRGMQQLHNDSFASTGTDAPVDSLKRKLQRDVQNFEVRSTYDP